MTEKRVLVFHMLLEIKEQFFFVLFCFTAFLWKITLLELVLRKIARSQGLPVNDAYRLYLIKFPF